MKSRIKIILYLLVVIAFVFIFFTLAGSYALFESEVNGDTDLDISDWVIRLSNKLITTGSTQTIVVNNFTYESSENVKSGKIAPGSSGYFDLVLDATACDVAVKYDISFDFNEMDYADNIDFIVSEIGGSSVVKTGPSTYSGIVSLDSINANEVTTLRVDVLWDDLEIYNESDTELGTTAGSKLAIPLSVKAVQHLGEELVPYVEPEPEDEPGEEETGDLTE